MFPRKNVLISLNATDFYGSSDGRLKFQDVGIVSGDIIYVKSRIPTDDIKRTRSSEVFTFIMNNKASFRLSKDSLIPSRNSNIQSMIWVSELL